MDAGVPYEVSLSTMPVKNIDESLPFLTCRLVDSSDCIFAGIKANLAFFSGEKPGDWKISKQIMDFLIFLKRSNFKNLSEWLESPITSKP